MHLYLSAVCRYKPCLHDGRDVRFAPLSIVTTSVLLCPASASPPSCPAPPAPHLHAAHQPPSSPTAVARPSLLAHLQQLRSVPAVGAASRPPPLSPPSSVCAPPPSLPPPPDAARADASLPLASPSRRPVSSAPSPPAHSPPPPAVPAAVRRVRWPMCPSVAGWYASRCFALCCSSERCCSSFCLCSSSRC